MMKKKSGVIAAPRLWLVIAKSYRALSCWLSRVLPTQGYASRISSHSKLSYIRARSLSLRFRIKCAWPVVQWPLRSTGSRN
jgi:hypothetical protein